MNPTQKPTHPLYPFRTLAHIKKANSDAGYNFFAPDTMDFFDSRIESRKPEIFPHHTQPTAVLFITSEQFHSILNPGYSDPRKYTIRQAHPDGSISSLSEFQQFDTYREAVEAMYPLQMLAVKQ